MEQRLTLISDDTKEFPNNLNSDFRVRLPERLSLPGSGWHVALLSLTLPNNNVTNAPYKVNTNKDILRIQFTILELHSLNSVPQYTDSTTDTQQMIIQQHHAIGYVTTGVAYWNQVVTELEDLIQGAVEQKRQDLTSASKPNPYVIQKQTLRPSFRWDGEDLILERSGSDGATSSAVYRYVDMALEVALQWGFVAKESSGNSYN